MLDVPTDTNPASSRVVNPGSRAAMTAKFVDVLQEPLAPVLPSSQ
jgi:hypothetical protein